MKKILITGANSYIGTSFEKYIKKNFSDDYIVDTVDLIDGTWRDKSFTGYDSVFHVAGIAHQKETKENAHLYYKVNRDLVLEVAKKAKADGVPQFVFLSSMSVYGMDTGIITKETKPNAKSNYGKSKWQAEQGLKELCDEYYKVCILRPPMVYGKGCKGNFNGVCSLVKKLPIFPRVKNRRSMIYIDNLSSFVKLCIDEQLSGFYFPQNKEYVATMEMARAISGAFNKKIYFDYLTGWAVCILKAVCPAARKGFGTLIYQDTEDFDFNYVVTENKQSFLDSVG
jgi:UDP-glucose 4-epimerase